MNVQRVSCASCGAPIQISDDIDRLNCTYCGAGLVVQRGEGYVALKLAEQMSRTIQDSGARTQTMVREGTQVTRAELKRLQLSQELSATHIQLSSIQTEIRGLMRQKRNRQIDRQLKELRKQESTLLSQIRELQEIPTLSGSGVQSVKPQVSATHTTLDSGIKRGCLIGCGVYLLVMFVCGFIATPLDQLILGVHSVSGSASASQGPFFATAAFVSFIAGVIAFLYAYSPDNPMWKPIKKYLQESRTGK